AWGIGAGPRCEGAVAPRQDAYRLGRDKDGRHLIIAVADGVSSSSAAEFGAATAVATAVDRMAAQLDLATSTTALNAADVLTSVAGQMTHAARAQSLAAEDVCCVLVVAAIEATPDQAGERAAWVAWVGDVSVWVREQDRWRFLLGDSKASLDGIHSSVVGACMPLHPERGTVGRTVMRPGDVLAFVTDGIGDAIALNSEVNAYLAQRWAQPPPAAAFLNDVTFEIRAHQDDRTAVVVWSPAAPVPARGS